MSKSPVIRFHGVYIKDATKSVSQHWDQICADFEMEFPQIRECCPGTFNIEIKEPLNYVLPDEEVYREMAKARGLLVGRYEDGNHLSPRVKVIQMNSECIEAWIYRGGHRHRPIIELIAKRKLADCLGDKDHSQIDLWVMEVPAGTPGMPAPPPIMPGKTIPRHMPKA